MLKCRYASIATRPHDIRRRRSDVLIEDQIGRYILQLRGMEGMPFIRFACIAFKATVGVSSVVEVVHESSINWMD